MTSVQMLARLRTVLDEASAGLWGDAECYSALADGQDGVISVLVNKSSEVLRPLITTVTGSNTTNLPSGYLRYISVVSVSGGITDVVWVRPYEKNRDHAIENTYLKSSATDLYCSFNATQIVFETNTSWSMEYYKTPTAIAAAQNPTLSVESHNAIVQFAFAFLLEKNKETERSMAELKKFYEMASVL